MCSLELHYENGTHKLSIMSDSKTPEFIYDTIHSFTVKTDELRSVITAMLTNGLMSYQFMGEPII